MNAISQLLRLLGNKIVGQLPRNSNQRTTHDPTRNRKHPRSPKVYFRSGDKAISHDPKSHDERPMTSEHSTDCDVFIDSEVPPSTGVHSNASTSGLLNGNQDQSRDPTRNKKHSRSSKDLSIFFRSGHRALSHDQQSDDEHPMPSNEHSTEGEAFIDSQGPRSTDVHSNVSTTALLNSNQDQRPTTRVDIVFKITLVLCVLMTLATLSITIVIGTRGQGSQGMSEPSSQSEVCVDNVDDSWSTSETDPKFEKLEKRTVNGARQVCAKNLEQLGGLTELATKMRKVKSEMYLAQQTRFTVTPVSAHKLLQSPDREINITEPAISNSQTVARLKSDTTDSPIEHANGVTVTKDSLLIQQPGLYYVYFGVHFQPVSDRPAKEFNYKKWVWYVWRTSSKTSNRKALLLQVAHTACDNCTDNTETSFAGGSFYLETGDHIQVAYAFLGVVKYNTVSSFLGLMMLDSGKQEHVWF